MKVKTMSALAGLGGALILSSQASASLVGLSVVLESANQATALGLRDVYRVYADFNGALDRVNVWGGGGNLGVGHIQTNNGTNFTQFGGAGGQIAPYSTGARDWDTYMTIGVRFGNQAPAGLDATAILPGTPVFIAGAAWDAPAAGGGVYITPDDDQGRADYIVAGNDTASRVLLMQLVVNPGAGDALPSGTIGVSWSVDGQTGSGGVVTGLTFAVPGPGSLALLGLAGLVGSRRRRA